MSESQKQAKMLKKLINDYKEGRLKTYSFDESKRKNKEFLANILPKSKSWGMKYCFSDNFHARLEEIKTFIGFDSIEMAMKFHNELYDKIYQIDFMPFKHRKIRA